ncbi:hypothetical protein AVEN_70035-1 [Araneus ventricosus]|uniref:Uncharacterized protein n=1 Tax=Araneus ventricosus TaxID=182803 RepID=A0A4Y2WKX9_ARAVE|nr:hypothetical protein AVEN_70035-1 [Araneus ventricosus]
MARTESWISWIGIQDEVSGYPHYTQILRQLPMVIQVPMSRGDASFGMVPSSAHTEDVCGIAGIIGRSRVLWGVTASSSVAQARAVWDVAASLSGARSHIFALGQNGVFACPMLDLAERTCRGFAPVHELRSDFLRWSLLNPRNHASISPTYFNSLSASLHRSQYPQALEVGF